jgi:hypothetical protein
LHYVSTLAIVYGTMQFCCRHHPFQNAWSPVFVLCKGNFRRDSCRAFSDVYTVVAPQGKQWHEWEQPLTQWQYWLDRLTEPGEFCIDPYCGSATIGLAIRRIGNRRYLGTDICRDTIRTARTRLSCLHD